MTLVGMSAVIAVHLTLQPDSHWFSHGAMNFFGTRLSRTAWRIGNEYRFVTSEQPPYGPRAFSVRVMDETGKIDTPAGVCAYPTAYAARRAMLA